MMAGRTIPVSALAPGSRSAISIVCRFFKACGRGVHSYTFLMVCSACQFLIQANAAVYPDGLPCLPVFGTGRGSCLLMMEYR